MTPTNKLPLFIVTGASSVGKSTLCEELFRNESRYIVLESDLIWNNVYNTPEDDYRAYRRMQLRLCANIAQAGKPVVLCGCAVPKQFESLPERELFTQIHYLTVVSDDDALKKNWKKDEASMIKRGLPRLWNLIVGLRKTVQPMAWFGWITHV